MTPLTAVDERANRRADTVLPFWAAYSMVLSGGPDRWPYTIGVVTNDDGTDDALGQTRIEAADLTADLTLLGRDARGPVEHVETFPAPTGCDRVVFSTDEVSSICPVTEQPDISSVRIDYVPDERCIESKSLKMYLWGFRNRKVFAEALAVEIADEVWHTVQPVSVHVAVTQHARGGIVTETFSSHPRPA